jgi:peptide/nickel transport system substrate-binding protein
VLAEAPGSTVVAAQAVGFHELGFNCWKSAKSKGNPLLRDPVIRQAVHWAIDKQKIVATSMAGLAEPGSSLVSIAQGDWHWEVPEAGRYRYDPVRAKRMLEDAGYSDRDGDGVRETAAGDELSFRLVALDEYPEDQAAARMIVSWCRDVGIELRLEQKDAGVFGDELYDDADYDMFIWSWGGDIDPGFILSTFTTRQIGGWGDSQYSNPEYDRLFVRQAHAVDPADPEDTTRRKAITDEMQKILYRDTPYVILWYNLNLQAFRTDKWRGYALAPVDGGAPFWNFMRATYIDLRPSGPRVVAEEDATAWVWALTAAAIVVSVVVVALVRRRTRAMEDA